MKLKTLYHVSFWFGIVYLILRLLSIPSMIVLFRSQGIGFSEFVNYISTGSFVSNFVYFGNIISGILIGVLIVTISLAVIRHKIKANKITDIGVGMISAIALVAAVNALYAIGLAISTSSIIPLVNAQVSRIGYPILPIFSFISLCLLTAGYIMEKLKTSSKKDFRVVFPAVALLTIILVNLVKIF